MRHPLLVTRPGWYRLLHQRARNPGGVLMSVFKFNDAVRVAMWKAAKRPSCRHTSCQLPTASERKLVVATARMRSARPYGEQIT